VFVDESGFQVGMTRTHARSTRGQRAHGRVLRNRGRTLTLLAGLTLEGTFAPMLIEGGTDREVFLAYLDGVLIPSLKPFQIVIMDNLGAHHAHGVRERIEAAGCSVLFLPPYSPDLNPIEMLFSKLKTLVRSLAHRTHATLTSVIARVLDNVTPDDCRGWFDHAGYRNKPDPLK